MIKLPAHKAALSITHNDHKSNYETIASMLEWRRVSPDQCGSQEEYDALCAGDEVWEVHWYPDTPNGFYAVFAATLERALELANGVEP
jgi:hypothetical protein